MMIITQPNAQRRGKKEEEEERTGSWEVRESFTLGPAGPLLHKGVLVVLQSAQNFFNSFIFLLLSDD